VSVAAQAGSPARAWLAFAITTLVWGSTWLVIKDGLGTVPPSWAVTWRFVLAGAGMFALALLRGERLALSPPALRLAAILGLLQFCANFQLVYRSEQYLTSGLVAVLFALLLVPNALLARIFVGTPVSGRFLAGSAVAIGGIGLLLLHEYHAAPAGGVVLTGLAFAAGAVMSASIANVLQASATARAQSGVVLLAWAIMLGTLANAALAWAISGPPVIDLSPRYLGGVTYLALIGSVLTFPLYFLLIREWGPGKAAYNGVLIPVVAMALSTAFEGYHWTTLAVAGSLLVLTGLVIALGGRQ